MKKTIDLFCDKALPIIYTTLILVLALKEKIGVVTAAFLICYTFILRRPS